MCWGTCRAAVCSAQGVGSTQGGLLGDFWGYGEMNKSSWGRADISGGSTAMHGAGHGTWGRLETGAEQVLWLHQGWGDNWSLLTAGRAVTNPSRNCQSKKKKAHLDDTKP